MKVKAFLQRVQAGEPVEFDETMAVIEANYRYRPTGFGNGTLENPPGTNEGSCKIFAFAKLHGLSEAETLQLFGAYYRRDVLDVPQGTNHMNIRNFMQSGWPGVVFRGDVLQNL